jgi:hypothetical protein
MYNPWEEKHLRLVTSRNYFKNYIKFRSLVLKLFMHIDPSSASKNFVGHYTLMTLRLESIWKIKDQKILCTQ